MAKNTLLFLAAAVSPAYGFWRMECRGVTGYGRIDPIVNPGDTSQHVHSILGSGGFSETSTPDDLRSSNCTSCLVTEDKSAYWHPALYFQDTTTGEFELVGQVGGTLAYYLLTTGSGDSNITAFPADFRMIAGDMNRRSYTAGDAMMVDPPKSDWASLNQTGQDILAQRALGFNCLDYSKTPESSLYRHFFPNKEYLDANCPDGIRFELMFPSCWNGVDSDSDNHKDHMAYPDLVMSGDCPSGYPVRVPSLFYETIWDTPSFSGRTGQFVLSNGDIEGFSYHGDFMMGWDVDFLQEAVNTCTSSSGEIQDCPLFTIQSEADAKTCKIATPENLASEDVDGPCSELPGGRAPLFGSALVESMLATYDPALSTVRLEVEATVGATIAVEATIGSVDIAVTAGAQLAVNVGTSTSTAATTTAVSIGGAFGALAVVDTPAASTADVSLTSVTSLTSTIPSPSPTTSTSTTPTIDPNVVSTQYVTNGNVVSEILWYATTVYEYEEVAVTTTVQATVTGVQARHAHGHMRRHHI